MGPDALLPDAAASHANCGGDSRPRTRWAVGFDPACLQAAAAADVPAARPLQLPPPRPAAAVAGACGDLRIYEEDELLPCPPPPTPPASRFMRELLEAHGPRQREAAVRSRLDRIGFDRMGYYGAVPGGTQRGFLATYTDGSRARRYFGARLHTVDPRWTDACGSTLPVTWDLAGVEERLAQEASCTLRRQLAHELRGSGAASGVIVPIAGAGGVTLVLLEAEAPSRRWIDDRVLAETLHFALVLHHHVSLHLHLAPAAGETGAGGAPLLPALQQAVLGQLAHGLTDRQIAERLRLSPHTVDYHLRQLRQRFSARNRVQLVAAAARVLGTA